MCGEAHLGMLQECLLSLYHAWSRLPRLQVVSDGSMTKRELTQALSWWPGDKSVLPWEDIVAYHRRRDRGALARFAKQSVIGRKLASVLQFGEQRPTLYCDADILWFAEPTLPKGDGGDSPSLILLEDYQPSYDENLSLSENLPDTPFLNTGLVYLSGNLCHSAGLRSLVQQASVESNHFTEQTILAIASRRIGGQTWPADRYICDTRRERTPGPSFVGKDWVARHYVGGLRHLFWQDALMLRGQKSVLSYLNS
jgi:hypothetical protein